MKNLKILVLEGGMNEEHEVSLETSKEVKKSLLNLGIPFETLLVNPFTFKKDIKKFTNNNICFNALHGTFGEDGRIQKILDELSFKYTHASSQSSKIGFDKELTKKKILDISLPTPKYITINYKEISKNFLLKTLINLGPFLIKPVSSGSSFGIEIFKNEIDIYSYTKNINSNLKKYEKHQQILIEKLIQGRELTVAVIEKNGKIYPVEVTEIISKNKFFDYKSKYTPGYSKHILPAQIPNDIYNKCKIFAKKAHEVIKCKGVSRSDFIFDNKEIYFLEINTQPGLTPISLVPEQLNFQNFSFNDLIVNLIKCAL